jgi:hypothetical protein
VWVCTQLCKLQKRCTRLEASSDEVYQLLAHGLWFSPDTPASSTTKTDRYDIAESGVKHNKSKLNQNLMLLHFNGMSRKKSFKYLFLMKLKYILTSYLADLC